MRKLILISILILLLLTSWLEAQEKAATAKEPTQEQMKTLQSNLNAEKDAAKKIDILKKFIDQFPESQVVPSAYNYILRLYVRELNDPDSAIAFAEDILKAEKTEANKTAAYIFLFNRYLENDAEKAGKMADKIYNLEIKDSSLFNNFAYALADKGVSLAMAEKLSKKSIDLNTLENLKNNPRFQNAPEDYLKRVINENFGYYYDTLGWIYYKQEKYQPAVEVLEKSLAHSDMDFLELPWDPDTFYHLGSVYMSMRKNEKSLPLLTKAALISDNEKVQTAFNESYQKKFGSTEGVKNYLKKQRKNLAKPAPDFTLKNLQGKEVSLSSFKGKVVLLDLFSPT